MSHGWVTISFGCLTDTSHCWRRGKPKADDRRLIDGAIVVVRSTSDRLPDLNATFRLSAKPPQKARHQLTKGQPTESAMKKFNLAALAIVVAIAIIPSIGIGAAEAHGGGGGGGRGGGGRGGGFGGGGRGGGFHGEGFRGRGFADGRGFRGDGFGFDGYFGGYYPGYYGYGMCYLTVYGTTYCY